MASSCGCHKLFLWLLLLFLLDCLLTYFGGEGLGLGDVFPGLEIGVPLCFLCRDFPLTSLPP